MYCTQCGKEHTDSTKLVQEATQLHKYMTKKQYLGLIILVVMIFGVLFYWYSYRTYYINKLCISSAMERVKGGGDQTDVRYFFWKCQKEHGLGNY